MNINLVAENNDGKRKLPENSEGIKRQIINDKDKNDRRLFISMQAKK